MSKNRYKFTGLILCITGAVLSPVFYFLVGSVPLTSVSLSAIMLGFISYALGNARPYLSPEACQMLLKTGMENTGALLEELGLKNKAIYIPSSLRNGRPQAIIPLGEAGVIPEFKDKLPGRLIVRYGTGPGDMAIAVTTPGNSSLDLLEVKPGPNPEEIQGALTQILVGVLDIADSITVTSTGKQIELEITQPKMHFENIWYYHSLGSPLASIAASVVSEALSKPVRISQENYDKKTNKSRVVIEVLP